MPFKFALESLEATLKYKRYYSQPRLALIIHPATNMFAQR